MTTGTKSCSHVRGLHKYPEWLDGCYQFSPISQHNSCIKVCNGTGNAENIFHYKMPILSVPDSIHVVE